jgi:hypothetical protein
MLKDGAVVNVSLGGEPNPGPSNSQKGSDSASSDSSDSSSATTGQSDSQPRGPLSPKTSHSAEKASDGEDTDAKGTTQSGAGTGGYQ